MFGQDPADSPSDTRQQLEQDMFGASDDGEEEEEATEAQEEQEARGDAAPGTSPRGEPSRDDAMFAQPEEAGDASSRIAQALLDTRDELAIGGFLFMQLGQSYDEGDPLDEIALSAPNLLDVYLDARPSERLRLYASGRILYDYT